MAKKTNQQIDFIVDRIFLIGALCAATGYIVRGTWASMFFYTGAIVLGIIWSYRAITTHPDRKFRLLASLVLVLLSILVLFQLARAQGIA